MREPQKKGQESLKQTDCEKKRREKRKTRDTCLILEYKIQRIPAGVAQNQCTR